MYLPVSPSLSARSVAHLIPSYTSEIYLFDDNGGGGNGTTGGGSGGNGSSGDTPKNFSSIIGITTAIVGNILIALALNVQRYAHIRLHRERKEARERARQAFRNAKNGASSRGYGSLDEPAEGGSTTYEGYEDDVLGEAEPLMRSFRSEDSRWSEISDDDEMFKKSSSYLKSPYWWTGQVLITVGEMGNFLAYGFAPASIVSPLGVVALISNCVIAPIFFKEQFRKRDFWGVVVAVGGAVTVVLSASTKETKLAPHDVWVHITTMGFEIYMGVTFGLIVLLMWLSPRYGNRSILIDLSLVGLFGGYTALSTKGVASMLSSTLLRAFTTPVTYVLIAILLGTAIMQVRYVNKALQRFDSTQVIPIQFVSFTLCVIIGSAVLYRDFERTTAEQALKFMGGCFLTFFGVFLITSGRPSAEEDDEETLSDEEDIEETIRLAEQDTAAVPPPVQSPEVQRRRNSGTTASRRSSRVSFMDAVNKPLAVLAETGVPTPRPQGGAAGGLSKTSLPITDESPRTPPLRPTLMQQDPPVHPGIEQTISSESAVTLSSATPLYSEPATHPGTPSQELPVLNIPSDSNPQTPRPSTSLPRPRSHSNHHFNSHIFSPSPLDSAVRGLVPSTLLQESPSAIRPPSQRRLSRAGLRNSLFVPQNILEQGQQDGGVSSGAIMSAIERSRTADGEFEGESPMEAPKRLGFRNRAKSLTHVVVDLFGKGPKKQEADDGDGHNTAITTTAEEQGPRGERPEGQGGSSRHTTDTE